MDLTKKSLAAILGTATGLIIAGTLAWIFSNAARLTGLVSEEAQMLQFIDETIDFDVRGLLLAGIIIGALGAILDVTMSVASSMQEIKRSQSSSFAHPAFFCWHECRQRHYGNYG